VAAADEFLALLAGLTVYDGKVPDRPAFPYVLALPGDSGPGERSQARTPQSQRFEARTTVVGLSAASVRVVSAAVRSRVEGRRVGGGRLEEVPNGQPILEDRDATDTATGLHPLYQPLEWIAVLSP
jgi:hypothetical protein